MNEQMKNANKKKYTAHMKNGYKRKKKDKNREHIYEYARAREMAYESLHTIIPFRVKIMIIIIGQQKREW